MKVFIVIAFVFVALTVSAQQKSAGTNSAKPADPALKNPAGESDPVESEKHVKDVTASTEGAECKLGESVRRVGVVTKDQGCLVEYTKDGETKIIGNAQNDGTFCSKIVTNVRTRLEEAGYTCKTR
jgi:hypothetical protein